MAPKKRKAPAVPHRGVMVAPQNVIDELVPYLALGFAVESTKHTGCYCGLFALAGSLRAVRNLAETIDDMDHLTAKDLRDIVRSDGFVQLVDDRIDEFYGGILEEAVRTQEREHLLYPDFFSSQQLDMVLSVVNKRLNTSYRLGVITSKGVGERERKVNGQPVPIPLKASKKKSAKPPKQEYEKETYAIEASAQIFGGYETGPVVFIHNENGARQLVPIADHWQSFGLNPSPSGIEEVRSWGMDPMVNAAVHNGIYIVEEDVDEESEDGSLGAVRGQFLYQQPFPDYGPNGERVLQTSSDHIYARNCSSTVPPPNPPQNSDPRPLTEGQVAQDDLRKISKVQAVAAIEEPKGSVVDLKMYVAQHPSPARSQKAPEEGEVQHKFKRNETPYLAGSIVLHVDEDEEAGEEIVRFQDRIEAMLSCFVLEPIKKPFLIGKIVRPLTNEATNKACKERYPQKIAEIREIASARGIDTKGLTKVALVHLLWEDDMRREAKPLALFRTGISDDVENWPRKTLVRVKEGTDVNGQVTIVSLRGRQARWPLKNLAEEPEAWGILLPNEREEEIDESPPTTVGQLATSDKGLDYVKVSKENNEFEVVTPPNSRKELKSGKVTKQFPFQMPTPPSSKKSDHGGGNDLGQSQSGKADDVPRVTRSSFFPKSVINFLTGKKSGDATPLEKQNTDFQSQRPEAAVTEGEKSKKAGEERAEAVKKADQVLGKAQTGPESRVPSTSTEKQGPKKASSKEPLTTTTDPIIKNKPAKPSQKSVATPVDTAPKKKVGVVKTAPKKTAKVTKPAQTKTAGATKTATKKPAGVTKTAPKKPAGVTKTAQTKTATAKKTAQKKSAEVTKTAPKNTGGVAKPAPKTKTVTAKPPKKKEPAVAEPAQKKPTAAAKQTKEKEKGAKKRGAEEEPEGDNKAPKKAKKS